VNQDEFFTVFELQIKLNSGHTAQPQEQEEDQYDELFGNTRESRKQGSTRLPRD
jgi:hypothetical protein